MYIEKKKRQEYSEIYSIIDIKKNWAEELNLIKIRKDGNVDYKYRGEGCNNIDI